MIGTLGLPVTGALAMQAPAQVGNARIPDEFYSASHALVIGIDDYRQGWPRLSNAVRDAQEIASALEVAGYDVTLVTNPERAGLLKAMREFFIVKGNDPDARLFLWFAGHGHTENGEGFIIPADGYEPEAGPKFRLTAIPMRDVSTYVRLAQSKHVFSVFDSCFAGTVFDTSRAAPPKALTQATTKPVRQFLTSGDAYQQVSDDGAFRELFIRLLTGTESGDLNEDGYVTATELGFYISDRMTNLTEGRQTPRYGKLRDRDYDLGDYVLAAYGQAPEPVQQTIAPQETAPAAFDERALELAFWNTIQSSQNPDDFQAYLDRYGETGVFSALAVLRIQRLAPDDQETSDELVETETVAALPKTPEPLVESPQADARQIENALGLNRRERSRIQRALTWLGYDTRGADGALGPNSRKAIGAYQRARSIEPTGYLTARQRDAILSEAAGYLAERDAGQKEAARVAALQNQNAVRQPATPEPAVPSVEPAALTPDNYDGTWQLTAKVNYSACIRGFGNFRGSVKVVDNELSGTLYSNKEGVLSVKGAFDGGQLTLDGNVSAMVGDTSVIWEFNKNIPATAGAVSSSGIQTSAEDYSGCRVKVSLSMTR